MGGGKIPPPLSQAPIRRSETVSCLRCKGASFQQSLHFAASSIWQAADGSGVVPTCGSKVTETKKDRVTSKTSREFAFFRNDFFVSNSFQNVSQLHSLKLRANAPEFARVAKEDLSPGIFWGRPLFPLLEKTNQKSVPKPALLRFSSSQGWLGILKGAIFIAS